MNKGQGDHLDHKGGKIMYAYIPVGDIVLCDSCNKEFTESNESGGIQVGSSAFGPCCENRFKGKKKNPKCPEGKSFANWVKEDLREGRPGGVEIYSFGDKIYE